MNLRIYLIYENKEDINLLRNSKLRVSGRGGGRHRFCMRNGMELNG